MLSNKLEKDESKLLEEMFDLFFDIREKAFEKFRILSEVSEFN